MTKVLITGGTGFIGGHLLPLLVEKKYLVILAVRHSFSNPQNLPLSSVSIGEINEQTHWGEALQDVDVVIHLAARAHQLNDQSANPETEFQRVNTQGTINLARQAIQAGVKHFIFISSVGAIATLSSDILTEETPCHPDSPYGRSKRQAEIGLIELCNGSGMDWTILRPTLVYGAGNPGNMERLIKLIEKNLPLPLGSINNKRSFIYVGNLVDAIVKCINHSQAKNEIFMISDDEDLSTPSLITRLGSALKKTPFLLPFPINLLKLAGQITGQVDVVDRLLGLLQVDSSKIREKLKWLPPYTVNEGLQITANWFKTQ
jgi:nucleoside-diphosphate-sugar epimerase